MPQESLLNGCEAIRKAAEILPSKPGVYRMVDAKGKVLYVGKAKQLDRRVLSYARPERLPYRLQHMIARVAEVETTLTRTESEALLLEANLIKSLRPPYNILLKDDKSFPYILITRTHDFPRITKHRGARKEGGEYFGPFPSAGAVNQAITDLQKAFLLRPCTDSFFHNRQRPCMEYQIKRCSAPCVEKISKPAYAELVEQALSFLKGQSREVQETLAIRMEKASAGMQYEQAGQFRDRIKALNQIQARQAVHTRQVSDADVLGLAHQGKESCVYINSFRGGQHLGGKPFFLLQTEEASAEAILAAFLSQYYEGQPVPPSILIAALPEEEETLETALTELAGQKVKLEAPKRGERKELLADAARNAEEALAQRQQKQMRQHDLLKAVAACLELSAPLKRIEVYDNSHTMGTYQIGAMIVAGEEGFMPKAYRRFNIQRRDSAPGDDYAMMEEVLTRRFGRLLEECPEPTPGIWPDVVLIDGGAGQRSVTERVFTALGLMGKIAFACIAKGPDRNAGREDIYLPGKQPFKLRPNDPALHYLQVLRDEAHRFAIGGHRKKREKALTASRLDDVPGIGATRKRALLRHFGSAEAVASAGLKELEAVESINTATARQIHRYFHGQD